MKKAQQIFKSMTIEQVYSRAEIKENAKLDSKQVYQPLILLVKEGVVTRDGDLYTRVKIHRAQSAMKGTPWSKTVNPIRTEAMKIVPGNLETVASCIAALERLAKDRALIKSRLTDLIDKY